MASSGGTRSCARICARDSPERGVNAETTRLVRDKPHHVHPGEYGFVSPAETLGTCFALLKRSQAAYGSRPVSGRSVRDVEHDDRVSLLIDPVTDPPILPAARGVLARILVAERVPDPVGVVQERADDELRGRGGDLLGKNG